VLLNVDSHQPRPGPLFRLSQLCSLLLAACSLKLSKSNFLTGAFEDNCIIEQAISTGVSLTSQLCRSDHYKLHNRLPSRSPVLAVDSAWICGVHLEV